MRSFIHLQLSICVDTHWLDFVTERRWRDKGGGKQEGAAAVYVPPELVFKSLALPTQSAPSPPPDVESGAAAPAAAAARVVPLTVEAPEGFFPANPIQVRAARH